VREDTLQLLLPPLLILDEVASRIPISTVMLHVWLFSEDASWTTREGVRSRGACLDTAAPPRRRRKPTLQVSKRRAPSF
jgi:hypothetical protein